jgi:hypothetical protein
VKHAFPILTALLSIVLLFALDKTACRFDPEYGFMAQVVTLAVIAANVVLLVGNAIAYART